jgi:sensor histidine kinase YesM
MARPDVAAQRLRHYLEALKSDGSPALYWFRYGKRPTIVQVGSTPAQFECTWMWCPIKVVFTVLSRDGSSAVEVKFKLRGGYFRIELFPNPVDVMHLTEYLDGQVLKLLDSELSLTEARERQESLRLQALEMQLRMLQSQVEPHFLFNTMANLRQLYRTDIVAGEAMLDHLIGYLRGAMQDLRADVTTVSKEFELAMHFLSIMKVRMGDRLAYQFICHDGAGSYSFPPAMLISLVENAVKHGLRDAKAGQLRITAAVDDGKLRVSVVDNGPGFSSVEGTGLGLSNIRQRLEAIYGMRAWLEVGAPADGGFISSIVVPAEPALQPQQEPQLS